MKRSSCRSFPIRYFEFVAGPESSPNFSTHTSSIIVVYLRETDTKLIRLFHPRDARKKGWKISGGENIVRPFNFRSGSRAKKTG
jgi:hypothetical protein